MKKTLFFVLIVTALLSVHPFSPSAEEIDRVLAVVNDDIITLSELEDRKQKLITEMSRMVNPSELQERINEVEEQTLDMMIEELLLRQKADEMGIEIDDEAINEALHNVMASNKIETMEDFELALKTEGMTLDEYKEMIRNQLKIFRVQNYEIKSKVRIIEDELKNFYTNNKEKFIQEKKYHIRHILIQFSSLVDEEVIFEKAQEVHKKLEQGEDFCSLAEEYSDDPTRKDCGDLGFIDEQSALPEFIEAIKSISAGSFSKPFKTKFGYHIVQLVEIEGGSTLPFEKVKNHIKERLFEEKFFKKRAEWLSELRAANYVKIIGTEEEGLE